MRKWTDKEGNKRTTAEVVADNVYFGDSKRDGMAPAQGGFDQRYSPAPTTFSGAVPTSDFSMLEDGDDELPF